MMIVSALTVVVEWWSGGRRGWRTAQVVPWNDDARGVLDHGLTSQLFSHIVSNLSHDVPQRAL